MMEETGMSDACSFIIENGKIGEAVSEVMINGNLADILNRLLKEQESND